MMICRERESNAAASPSLGGSWSEISVQVRDLGLKLQRSSISELAHARSSQGTGEIPPTRYNRSLAGSCTICRVPRGLGTAERSAAIWCAVMLGAEGRSRESVHDERSAIIPSGSSRRASVLVMLPPSAGVRAARHGDHAGLASNAGLSVSLTTPDPSAFIV